MDVVVEDVAAYRAAKAEDDGTRVSPDALGDDLAGNPRPRESRTLVGEQVAWRIRIGDCRVIHDVVDDLLTVTVVRAAHRREIHGR
ncbi:MAG: type II toxin-antitoxin system RelE family toxin [Phycicoccus sp.]